MDVEKQPPIAGPSNEEEGQEEHEDWNSTSEKHSRSSSVEQRADPGDDKEPGTTPSARPGISRTTSASSRQLPVIKVPRNERSGLFGRLTAVYEAEEPKNYPRSIKWFITFWVGVAAVCAPLGSSIILPCLPEITSDFNTDATIANLSVALYMLSMSMFPLWWSAFSEAVGRRTVYIVSFSFYILFNVLSGISTSIGMFIAFRLLSGGTSASVQAIGAGTVADIWDVKERGRAMGTFYLGPLAGPLVAPVIGGALSESLGWRSTQWAQVIYGGLVLLGILFCLPETLHHKGSAKALVKEQERQATNQPDPDLEQGMNSRPPSRPPLSRVASRQSIKDSSGKSLRLAHEILVEPLKITRYLRFPPVALTVYYASVAFMCLYFLNISVEKTFQAHPYNFNEIDTGLLYLSNSTGYFATSILGGKWVDKIMAREARKAGRVDHKGKLHYLPEDRVRENAWVGGLVMPAALIWYAWSAEYGVYWFCPIFANFFFGAGSMLIFAMATTMLTEFMPKKASNGVALNNFLRNIFAFIGDFLAEPIINAIGNGWLFTILGIIALLSCFVNVAMRRYGDKWRKQMDEQMS